MKRLLISVLCIIAISQYFWLQWSSQPQEVAEFDRVALPDYQITALNRTEYDPNGQIHSKLSAQSLEHYQELEFTYFQNPRYILYSSNQQQSWVISANESVIYDNRQLELEGKVSVMTNQPDEWFDTLYVNRLNMDLTAQTISTSAKVTGVADKLTFSGQGLRGNLKTQEFELVNQVRAEYFVKQ
ncbi:hypothetical protein DS2_14194 [Catenovulum agarivorans DS-2]|uniref:Lipopolysaccharide export system protein LptC n=1 Tax=Catenovulum agarivorans DS-2 TaxID=1328313 RepID=W7QAZ7_9ALTE|nr:LPS export ABC transporter periplasmic protein LptC [Catenovulum agarivorans]EWH09131.1 hypothetical protein DS2_14194 [Catenovulum agarivorans DS-2]